MYLLLLIAQRKRIKQEFYSSDLFWSTIGMGFFLRYIWLWVFFKGQHYTVSKFHPHISSCTVKIIQKTITCFFFHKQFLFLGNFTSLLSNLNHPPACPLKSVESPGFFIAFSYPEGNKLALSIQKSRITFNHLVRVCCIIKETTHSDVFCILSKICYRIYFLKNTHFFVYFAKLTFLNVF